MTLHRNALRRLIFAACGALVCLLPRCQVGIGDGAWPDLIEFESVWQYLKAYSIYQQNIPEDPFVFDSPESLLRAVGDTSYTRYYIGAVASSPQTGEFGVSASPVAHDTTVWVDALTDSTAILTISSFTSSTYADFVNVQHQLYKFQKLVIDLRGNPGGELHQLDSIVEAFLPRGTGYILARERSYDRDSRSATTLDWHYWKTGGAVHPSVADKPIAVLIDDHTASAAEILAAALKDCSGAHLIGSQSYGKGIGQIRLPRHKRPFLQITYLQLKGISERTGDYHGIGIVPDTLPASIVLSAIGTKAEREVYYAVKLLEPSLPPGTPFVMAKTQAPSDSGCYTTAAQDVLDIK